MAEKKRWREIVKKMNSKCRNMREPLKVPVPRQVGVPEVSEVPQD